jgi:PAS domain S-box-containing protein
MLIREAVYLAFQPAGFGSALWMEMDESVGLQPSAEVDPSLVQAWTDVLELLPDAVFIVDGVAEGGRISYLNAQASRMFGYAPGELVNQSIDLLVPRALRARHMDHRHEYAQSPTLRSMGAGVALFGQRQDGSEFPIDVLLKSRNGSATSATIAIVRDMTALHAALAAHERERQLLIDKLPMAVAYMDRAERLQFANAAFRGAAHPGGIPRDATARSVLGGVTYAASGDARQSAQAGQRASAVVPVSIAGQQRIHEVTYVPDFDAAGAVQGVYRLSYDVTEREQLSAALRVSEERARELFTQASEGIFIADLEGRYKDANPAACAMLGYTRAEILGLSSADLAPPEDLERLGQSVARLKAGDATLANWRLRHKDGHYVPVELSGKLLSNDRLMGFARDITERQRLEIALMHARDAAIQANEVKSRFLAAASHDLRQPLQTIWNLQSVLARALKHTEYAPHLAVLEEAVRNMDQMLSTLIDINRLEKGAIHPVVRDFSLQEILPGLRSEFGYAATSKSLVLDIEESREFARSDPMLLLVILRNLIGNAIKYTKAGTIRLTARKSAEQLYIDISDTGPGIPPEHLELIFDAFYQIDGPGGDQRQGVGLGLSIVQTVCRLLGHIVTIESRVGEGSTFTVQLPIGVPVRYSAEPSHTSTPKAELRPGTARVLHIEDDPGVARSMAMLLRLEGYEVIGAASRDEALEHIHAHGLRPDLILCDFQLPMGFTGDEIVAEIAAALKTRPPTIMLTGDIADRHVEMARLAADRILRKPVDIELLLMEMRRLLAEKDRG